MDNAAQNQDGRQQAALFRSKNLLDLDRATREDQSHACETPFDDSELNQIPDSSQNLTSNEFNQNESDHELLVSRYVNIDTQTSFSTDIFAEEEEEEKNQQQDFVGEEPQSLEPVDQLPQPKQDLPKIDELEEEIEAQKPHTETEAVQESQKLNLLRHLLSVERQCSETRRQNLILMQKHLKELQNDYLRQQRELIEALELAHKIKNKKDSELDVTNETVREKDKLIEQLRAQIESLDESKLRAEFKAAQDKQHELYELELQQLRNHIASVEQQLVRERVCNSQTMVQFQEKLADQIKIHESETNRLKERAKNFERDLERLLNEPQNLVIKTLKEEKFHSLNEIDELRMHLDESRTKYDKLCKRLEFIQMEQELCDQKNQEEIIRLQESCGEQRRLANELSLELESKHELIEKLQFDLQKSEKRARVYHGNLKGKEMAYKEIVNQLQVKNEQQAEKAAQELRLFEERIIHMSSQIDKKQNELKRMELEYENRLESMRNDRDQRISRLEIEKQRIEKELKTAEVQLARELEMKNSRAAVIEQLRNEATQFKEESKRLSIELVKSEAKLHNKQQELEKALGGFYEEIGSKHSLSVQDADPQQVASVYELEEARRHSKRLETSTELLRKENEKLTLKLRISESNLVRLNANITREQAKMYRECEKKLAQIMADQCVYNKYKLRYKKYGNKLKKYYQHLNQVHNHFCNSATCGPTVNDSSSQEYSTHVSSRDSESTKYNNEYSLASIG